MNPSHRKLLKKAQTLELDGNALESSSVYQQYLKLVPADAAARADYGGQLLRLGRLEESRKACDEALAIDPAQVSARVNLAIIHMRQDRLDASEEQLRTTLNQDPRRMDAALLLAECLLTKRDLKGARQALQASVRPGALDGHYSALQSQFGELWAICSSALFEQAKWEEAEEACFRALELDPINLTARSNLGSIQMTRGDLESAEQTFRLLLAEQPHHEQLQLLLITCLTRRGALDLVHLEIIKAIQLHPNSLEVHKSIVGTWYNQGRWTEYQAEIERFRKVDPASAHPDWEQSLMELLLGDFSQGWEHYEARHGLPAESKAQRIFGPPAWRGGAFEGKSLLLWAEQGFGDTLMFVRYLPLVKALGGTVILEAQPALRSVVATCPGADAVIPRGAPLPHFDLQASLMSLPRLFRTDLSSIPAQIPYLDVPAEVPNRQAILETLARAQGRTRIGLVWAGRPGYGRDFERSLPADLLAPLGDLPGVAWFSLQVGREEVPSLPDLVTLAPGLKDFSDTAYALSGMDLLISVDTAVAHLAGALGIPTFLLLPFQPDFRWLMEREDSPWYPSFRLYRQPAYGDWESVVQRVLADLSATC